jgi:hypothetical protein
MPFYILGLAIFISIPLIYKLKLPEDEEDGEEPQFMKALMNFVPLYN